MSMQHCFHVFFYIHVIGTQYLHVRHPGKEKSFRTCLTVIFQIIIKCGAHAQNSKSLFFCCFWINVTQINFENIKKKIQRIISDSCFQLKSRFNVDARAPSIPLLNFPFKRLRSDFNCCNQTGGGNVQMSYSFLVLEVKTIECLVLFFTIRIIWKEIQKKMHHKISRTLATFDENFRNFL